MDDGECERMRSVIQKEFDAAIEDKKSTLTSLDAQILKV